MKNKLFIITIVFLLGLIALPAITEAVEVQESPPFWQFTTIEEEGDKNGDGLPDLVPAFTAIDSRTIEIFADDTVERSGGPQGYKWGAAVCNSTGAAVGKSEYNPATQV